MMFVGLMYVGVVDTDDIHECQMNYEYTTLSVGLSRKDFPSHSP